MFDWFVGSCQVKLLTTELGCSEDNCFFYTNAFFAAFVLCIFYKAKQYSENVMPQSYKTQIKIQPYPGLAVSGYRSSAFGVT